MPVIKFRLIYDPVQDWCSISYTFTTIYWLMDSGCNCGYFCQFQAISPTPHRRRVGLLLQDLHDAMSLILITILAYIINQASRRDLLQFSRRPFSRPVLEADIRNTPQRMHSRVHYGIFTKIYVTIHKMRWHHYTLHLWSPRTYRYIVCQIMFGMWSKIDVPSTAMSRRSLACSIHYGYRLYVSRRLSDFMFHY